MTPINFVKKNYFRFGKLQNTLLLLVGFVVLSGLPVRAQEVIPQLSTAGIDPTEPRNRFDAFLGRIEPLASGYILEIGASGNLTFAKWGSVGMTVPMVYADFPSTTTFELGDIQLNTLLQLYRNRKASSFKAVALGVDFFMNTGDVETGTGFGQYVIAPLLSASFYPSEEIMVAPIVEEYISLEKDPDGKTIHDLSLRLNTTLTMDMIWITLVPELLIDLLGDKQNLWNLRSSLGAMINPNVGFSADVVSQLAGDKRFNYLGRISMRYLF